MLVTVGSVTSGNVEKMGNEEEDEGHKQWAGGQRQERRENDRLGRCEGRSNCLQNRKGLIGSLLKQTK